MLTLVPRAIRRAHPARRIHDAGARFAATAWRRWFFDRDAEFWLRELGTGWSLRERRARIVDVVVETSDTRTLVLAPGRGWPGHLAGQYVPVELEVDGVRLRRCYSISSGGSAPGARRIAITVRRVAGGQVSTALHRLRRGDRLTLGEPAGDFVVDRAARKLLLVAGGSGVTPIIAMLRDLAALADASHDPATPADANHGHAALSDANHGHAAPANAKHAPTALFRTARDVVVVHGSRSAADAIFAAELASLATRFAWLQVRARRDDEVGRLDAATLAALVPDLADRDTFVCGPPGLIDVVHAAAREAGASHRVHTERFVAPPLATMADGAMAGGAMVDGAMAGGAMADGAMAGGAMVGGAMAGGAMAGGAIAGGAIAGGAIAGDANVQLLRAGLRVVASGPGPLLAQLERAGQRPAYGCRMGICNTCRCRKRSGTVEDLTTGVRSSEPDQDIRLCVSLARSDLELEL